MNIIKSLKSHQFNNSLVLIFHVPAMCLNTSVILGTMWAFEESTTVTNNRWVDLLCVNTQLIPLMEVFGTLSTLERSGPWLPTDLGMLSQLTTLPKHFRTHRTLKYFEGFSVWWFLHMFLQFVFWNLCLFIIAIFTASNITVIQVAVLVK